MKRALVSVSDKSGLVEFVKGLEVSDSVKNEILVITPQNYVGK